MHIFLILSLLASIIGANEPCFAPRRADGPLCKSSSEYVGTERGSTILYTITLPPNVNIVCNAYAASQCPIGDCLWKPWTLNIFGNGTQLMTWGNHADFPAIRCRGEPTSFNFTWSWQPGEKKCFPGCWFGPKSELDIESDTKFVNKV